MIMGGILLKTFTNRDLFFAINSRYNDVADSLMYYTTMIGQGEIIVVVLLGLMHLPRFRNWWYFVTAVLCNLVPFFIQQWLKVVFNSPRPLNYFHHADWMHWNSRWPYLTEHSFPSGHTAGAFSFFCFLTLLLPPKSQPWGLLFFILAAAVGYSRIYLTAHFFADVYAGSVLGTILTTAIFVIMDRYRNQWQNRKPKSA